MLPLLSPLVLTAALIPRAQPEKVVGPPEAVLAAGADIQNFPPKDAYTIRYLWEPRDDEKGVQKLVQRFHWNLLSGRAYPGSVYRVVPGLYRIDLVEFGLEKRLGVWEKFINHDFAFTAQAKLLKDASIRQYWPGGRDSSGDYYKRGRYTLRKKAGDVIFLSAPWVDGDAALILKKRTCSEIPVVYGTWALVQSARQLSIRNADEGTGYYDFLGFKSRDDFFDRIGLDEKESMRLYQVWREVVQRSGVSQQSRQVVVYGAVTGPAYGTLDTFDQSKRGQPKRNLRGGEFRHDAEEWFGFNAQGLPVTIAVDAGGVLQSTVPDKVGPNKSPRVVGNDLRIHPNLSCLDCHSGKREWDWLEPVGGWARKHFRPGGPFKLQDPSRKTFLELRDQYLGEFNELLWDGRAKYARAVARITQGTTVFTADQLTDLYVKEWNWYVEEDVTPERAALELGVTKELFLDRLRAWDRVKGGSDLVLSEYLDGGSLTRLEWEDSYAYAQALVRGLYPLDQVKKVKPLP
jgi:hypothetical protein